MVVASTISGAGMLTLPAPIGARKRTRITTLSPRNTWSMPTVPSTAAAVTTIDFASNCIALIDFFPL